MNGKVSGASTMAGKVFAVAVGLLFLMVTIGLGAVFLAAKKQADNRGRHPVIGQPSELR